MLTSLAVLSGALYRLYNHRYDQKYYCLNGAQPPQNPQRKFMEIAVDAMAKCEGNGPRVGTVIELHGNVVAVGNRSEGVHAERAAIEDALSREVTLRGATLYSTLEPCVEAGATRECCAELIKRVGIKTVYIGRYDPNPLIYREGWKRLRDAGILLRDFEGDLRTRIDEMNLAFAENFARGIGPKGGAKFDYLLNEGRDSVL